MKLYQDEDAADAEPAQKSLILLWEFRPMYLKKKIIIIPRCACPAGLAALVAALRRGVAGPVAVIGLFKNK